MCLDPHAYACLNIPVACGYGLRPDCMECERGDSSAEVAKQPFCHVSVNDGKARAGVRH